MPAPVPDIFMQDFESGTIPSGWTTSAGSPNYGYTPALSGNYSLNCSNASSVYTILSPTRSELYFFAQIKLDTLTAGGFIILNPNSCFEMYILATGAMRVFDMGFAHQATTVSTMATNQLYYIWMHYKAGSGANATCTFAFNTSLSEPTSGNNFASVPTANSTNLINFTTIYSTGGNTIIDHIGSATFDMPNGW